MAIELTCSSNKITNSLARSKRLILCPFTAVESTSPRPLSRLGPFSSRRMLATLAQGYQFFITVVV